MLIIDKEKEQTRFILTLTEVAPDATEFTLNIFSPYSSQTFQFTLADNSSEYPERYDEFTLETSLFANCKPGKMNYKILNGDDVIEEGILMVVDKIQTQEEQIAEQYISIEPEETDDDFIVYNGE